MGCGFGDLLGADLNLQASQVKRASKVLYNKTKNKQGQGINLIHNPLWIRERQQIKKYKVKNKFVTLSGFEPSDYKSCTIIARLKLQIAITPVKFDIFFFLKN